MINYRIDVTRLRPLTMFLLFLVSAYFVREKRKRKRERERERERERVKG